MIDNIFETLIILLDVFNNPIGISALIIALIFGGIMCRFSKLKTLITCMFTFLLLTAIGLLFCTAGNTPDYLWIPILCFPFFAILAVFSILKWLLIMMKGRNK